MTAMQIGEKSRTRAVHLIGAAVAAAIWLAAGPASAQSSTTVTPAGDGFSASLTAGSSAVFQVATVSVTCNTSTTTGAVPAAPDNHSDAGSVGGAVTNPTFRNGSAASCPTNIPFTTATTTSTSTAGSWAIDLQFDAAGSIGTLTIPQGGVVTRTSGLAACTVTVAPTGPVQVQGTWVDGTATSSPRLVFTAVTLPIAVTGGGLCPTSATTATFSSSYDITDTTSSADQIAVSP